MTREIDPASREREALARMWSRRAVLGAGLGGAAVLGLARGARANGSNPHGGTNPNSLVPRPDLLVLVNRTSHGYTPALYAEALARGYDGYLDWQLQPNRIDDSALDAQLAAFPSLSMTARQLQDNYVTPGNGGAIPTELRKATLLRATYSQRQLFERMVEFWTDHFNIDQTDGENQVLKTPDDRDVVRAHALGKFSDLLKASAHSGAMLYYLDNYTNKNTGVNENYAREVMELHTLAPGNYTETDVRELAKVLTGWTIWRTADPAYGLLRFRPEWHDNGVHTVLGNVFGPNGGQAEGEAMLDVLANHPACARFVSKKLCRWLLSYTPSDRIVGDVTDTYLATGGDIKAMIRTALRPENVLAAAAATEPKLKRPFTFVVSLLRATNANVTSATNLLSELLKLGQVPFTWGPPDGFPDAAEYWGANVLPRWSFASRLLDNAISGVTVDTTALFSGVAQVDCAERCNELLAGRQLAPSDVGEIDAFVRGFASFTTQAKRESLALAAASPSFQTY